MEPRNARVSSAPIGKKYHIMNGTLGIEEKLLQQGKKTEETV